MLKARLSNLIKPFNESWVSEFHRFMQLVDHSQELKGLIDHFGEDKIIDQEPLVTALDTLVADGKQACQTVAEKAADFPEIATKLKDANDQIVSFKMAEDTSSLYFDPVRVLYDFTNLLREQTNRLIECGGVELRWH